TRPRDGELNQHRGKGQEDDPEEHPDHPETAGVAAVATIAAEPQRPLRDLRDIADRAGHGGYDGHDQRVAVAHVTDLLRQDRGELALIDDLEDPTRRGHDGVLRIATGGEGVRRGLVDDVDLRHRYVRELRHLRDHAVELRRLSLTHRMRAGEAERDTV